MREADQLRRAAGHEGRTAAVEVFLYEARLGSCSHLLLLVPDESPPAAEHALIRELIRLAEGLSSPAR
jgi:hypothetical protein